MNAADESTIQRELAPTAFSGILGRFSHNLGAISVALVDREGETVEYVGRGDPYAIRVMAAELRLVLQAVQATSVWDWKGTHELVLAGQRQFIIIALTEGYALTLETIRDRAPISSRALAQVARELEAEVGLKLLQERPIGYWHRVRVRPNEPHKLRPKAIWYREQWVPLTIIGRHNSQELHSGELGYLVRLPNGAEFPLVCEVSGFWFAETQR